MRVSSEYEVAEQCVDAPPSDHLVLVIVPRRLSHRLYDLEDAHSVALAKVVRLEVPVLAPREDALFRVRVCM